MSSQPANQTVQSLPEGLSIGNQAALSMLESQPEAAPTAGGGTPLEDGMRRKFEEHFGLPMDDVRVHRDSDQPAKFDAGAYTYGTDIFVGPGQEDLLSHEMTHVAQQKMGLVRPTGQENGLAVNRSPSLDTAPTPGQSRKWRVHRQGRWCSVVTGATQRIPNKNHNIQRKGGGESRRYGNRDNKIGSN